MPAASLLPLFGYILIGIALRASGVLGREQAGVLFRLVFHVTLPALAGLAVADANLTGGSALLPVVGFTLNVLTLAVAWRVSRRSSLAADEAGVLLLSASITNMVFMFPFVLAALGPSALADAVLIDFGNAVFVATVSNAIAIRFGHRATLSVRQSAARLLRTPLFVALLAAIILNLGGWQVPTPARIVLDPLGAATIPLTLIAVGLSLNLAHLGNTIPVLAAVLRMAVGLVGGVIAVLLIGFEADRAIVVVASAAAPVGFNAVTLTSVAKLDTEQAAAAVSLSVIVGIPSTVALLWLGRVLFVGGS
jgi:predicted permease